MDQASNLPDNATGTLVWLDTSYGMLAEFRTRSSRVFQIRFINLTIRWSMGFNEVSPTMLWVQGRGPKPSEDDVFHHALVIGTRLPTGRGEAHQILSCVSRALEHFLINKHPTKLNFRGATGRQSALYLRLLAHHAPLLKALGYHKTNGLNLVPDVPKTKPAGRPSLSP